MGSADDFRRVAVSAARESGKLIRENFGRVTGVRIKHGDWRDLVTDIDLKANDIITRVLGENFPGHGIVSEEAKPVSGNEFTWYVDPLDGTTNYTLAIPFVGTCIGLIHRGEPILGVVYNPVTYELFIGEKGRGATLNGERIKVSENDELKKTLVTFCHNYSRKSIEATGRHFGYFKTNAKDYRKLGSGNLEICWVACGRNDVYMRPDVVSHDIIPGYVVAKEAGARITDWKGRPWTMESGSLLVTNGTKIHDDVMKVVNR